jgi:hypothetical protein
MMAETDMRGRILVLGFSTLVCLGAAFAYGDLDETIFPSFEHPSIQYTTRPVADPVARLSRKIADGTVRLEFEEGRGYLRSLLEALEIPVESQMLVFSKNSLQSQLISPRNPRSIFFGDSVAVAWVRGGITEIAAHDPQQGVVFYVMLPVAAGQPLISRRYDCLGCHVSYSSLGVPGMMVRSLLPDAAGAPNRQLGDYTSDHRSAFEHRWGGWYVTGNVDAVRHLGNATYAYAGDPEAKPVKTALDPASVPGGAGSGSYLTPYSDAAALMVFEHQVRMINLITRVGWETRLVLHQQRSPDTLLDVSLASRQDLRALLRDTARELVDYLLFVEEEPLPGRIRSTSGFAEKFAGRGPHDRRGRSLRQLDLTRRLMRYPCSYMIYTQAFDALPAETLDAVYRRMWQVLSGADPDQKYARLALADRRAIVEILRETKKGLPEYFGAVTR